MNTSQLAPDVIATPRGSPRSYVAQSLRLGDRILRVCLVGSVIGVLVTWSQGHCRREYTDAHHEHQHKFRIHLPLASRHGSGVQRFDDAVALAKATGRLPVLDATAQTAVIFQESGVHRALESDVQMRDVALGEGAMFTPPNVSRLKSPAVSSWSRLKRSSDPARTTSNRQFSASRISA